MSLCTRRGRTRPRRRRTCTAPPWPPILRADPLVKELRPTRIGFRFSLFQSWPLPTPPPPPPPPPHPGVVDGAEEVPEVLNGSRPHRLRSDIRGQLNNRYDSLIMIYDMIWYDSLIMIWYDMIWFLNHDMIWYDSLIMIIVENICLWTGRWGTFF